MRTETITFQPIRRTVSRRVTCPGCGKKRRVQETIENTVSGFHPAVRALPPSSTYQDAYDAVAANVERLAAEWQPAERQAYHQKCWKSRNHIDERS